MSWEEFCHLNRVEKKYIDLQIYRNSYEEYVMSQIKGWMSSPSSCVIYGDVGRGKTWLMYWMCRMVCGNRNLEHLRYFKTTQLDDRLLEMTKTYSTARDFIKTIADVEFLFIDDLGLERDSDRFKKDFYDIINDRTANEKKTIITTNLDHNGILEMYDARILSRLKDSKWIELKGHDRREGFTLEEIH